MTKPINWDTEPSDILADLDRGLELAKRAPPPPIEIMSPERHEQLKRAEGEMTPTNELKKAFEKCTEVIKECGEALKTLPKERSHMAKVTAKQRLQRKKKKKKRQQKKKSR